MILCFTIYILDNEFNAGLTSILKYNKSTTKEKNKQKNNNNSNKKKQQHQQQQQKQTNTLY